MTEGVLAHLYWDPREHPNLASWLLEELENRGFFYERIRVPTACEPMTVVIYETGNVGFLPQRSRRFLNARAHRALRDAVFQDLNLGSRYPIGRSMLYGDSRLIPGEGSIPSAHLEALRQLLPQMM